MFEKKSQEHPEIQQARLDFQLKGEKDYSLANIIAAWEREDAAKDFQVNDFERAFIETTAWAGKQLIKTTPVKGRPFPYSQSELINIYENAYRLKDTLKEIHDTYIQDTEVNDSHPEFDNAYDLCVQVIGSIEQLREKEKW